MDDWDRTADGNLASGPVIGWSSATAQMIGLLRLRVAHSETEFEAGGRAIQMHMTPVQLRQLARDLLRMADSIDAQYLGTEQ